MIGQYPENAVVTFDSCNNERGSPLLVGGVDLCTVIEQQFCSFALVTESERQSKSNAIIRLTKFLYKYVHNHKFSRCTKFSEEMHRSLFTYM